MTPRRLLAIALSVATGALTACGSDGGPGGGSDGGSGGGSDRVSAPDPVAAAVGPSFVLDTVRAIEAVEAELGAGQRYFEVTANSQFTNVFVAVDDATAAVPYLFVDGELQPPAPLQSGATGQTFGVDDVTFDPTELLGGLAADLPDTRLDALSLYGDGVGVTYVFGATSAEGGLLDIVVAANGRIVAVDPL